MATVLVADDQPANRLLIVALLEHAGHRCVQASDGSEALKLALEIVPDLLVTDLGMPGLHGVALLEALRADDRTKQLPIVLYTATTPNAAMRDVMTLFAVRDVIEKPAEPDAILRVVKAALAGTGSQPGEMG